MMPRKAVLFSQMNSRYNLNIFIVVVICIVLIILYYSFLFSLPFDQLHYLNSLRSFLYFEISNRLLGVLLSVLLTYTAITLKWKHTAIISLCAIALIFPYLYHFSFDKANIPFGIAFLLIPPLLIVFGKLIIHWRHREIQSLKEKERERKKYLAQIYKTQEMERKRIAQELHDGIIQEISVVNSRVRELSKEKASKICDIKNDLEYIENSGVRIIDELRRICKDLRPSILDNLGLIPALKWLVESIFKDSNVNIKFFMRGGNCDLTPDISATIFRLVQEALNNAKKHAEATELYFSIFTAPGAIDITIQDNGKGMTSSNNLSELANRGKFGIIGMYERSQSIGALLSISSHPNSGTTVNLSYDKINAQRLETELDVYLLPNLPSNNN